MVSRHYNKEAKEAFSNLEVTVMSGHRFLGGFIGDADGRRDYIQQKVTTWCDCIEKLSSLAISQYTNGVGSCNQESSVGIGVLPKSPSRSC